MNQSLPKAAGREPIKVDLEAGKTYSFCTCGLSETQPFCDGAHKKVETDLKSLKFSAIKSGTYWLCMCKHTKNTPFCDSTHKTLAE